jgi:hypothetical protein
MRESMDKPKSQNSTAEKELDKAEAQFQAFDENIKEMTLDRMNEAKKRDMEPQTKLSSQEIDKSKDIYLKPARAISSKEKFNEKFREDYNFQKEYVRFIAENKEIIGETIEVWTKPFPGMAAEFWQVPTNKPIWGPRYLAEQITKAKYHRFVMQDAITGQDGTAKYYGQMAVDTIIQRLDALPVSTRKSIFMGAAA